MTSFAAIPTIVTQLFSIAKTQGMPIILDCNVTSLPLPTIYWFKNGILLNQNYMITLSTWKTFTTSRLTINNSSVNDQGIYRCNGTNAFGSTVADVANVTIYSKYFYIFPEINISYIAFLN